MEAKTDAEMIRDLYDMRAGRNDFRGGSYDGPLHEDLRKLREKGSVHEGTVAANLGLGFFGGLDHHDYLLGNDDNHYTIVSWDAANHAFRDTETFSSDVYTLGPVARAKFKDSILEMSGTRHERYRTLVNPDFARKRSLWWVDRFIGGAAERLVDEFIADGKADLNLQFCSLLPLYTISASLGIEDKDALVFSDLVNQMNRAPDPSVPARRIEELMTPLVEERRREPKDDLLSNLLAAELVDEDGAHALGDREIMGFARVLLTAGLSTTWRQLGIFVYLVLRDPALRARVEEDPTIQAKLIEEMMRWEGTETIMRRHVAADTVLDGVELPKGSIVEICMTAANRDPNRWDDPETFDPDRVRKPHLAFGGGAHICLGMHVARAEITTALSTILRRLRNVRIDPTAEEIEIIGFEARGVNHLPVVWDV